MRLAFRLSAITTLLILGIVVSGCNEKNIAIGFPRKPIKVIVPFDAGGGSDTFTRIIQKTVDQNDLLSQPMVVINVPGASGTIGSRRVKNARPDGYTILQLHEGILTSKYSGNADYGPEAFVPIAGTGRMSHVIAVQSDSPYQDLRSLLDAAKSKPDSIVFAVGIGAPSHYAGLMLENTVEKAEFRFTQSGGGAKRFASLLGGHSDVTTFSVAEFIDFRASGLKALAILSDTRHQKVPNVPTAKEQGLDVVSTNMHYWWAPKGTPPDRIKILSTALESAVETAQVQTHLGDLATDAVVIRGKALTNDLSQREEKIAAVSNRQVGQLPNFPIIVLVGTCIVGFLVALDSKSGAEDRNEEQTRTFAPALIAGLVLLYVASMHWGLLGFPLATGIFVAASGLSLSKKHPKLISAVALLSVVLAFGLHALFTQLLVIDLP